GVQQVQLRTEQGAVQQVRVDMGEPILSGLRIPTVLDEDQVVDYPIEANGQLYHFTAVSMGNPHCVIAVDDASNFDYSVVGPMLEKHELFPKKTNVEFITVNNRKHV